MKVRRAAVAPIVLAALSAEAGRPMITEDARVLQSKACQLESWVRRNPDSTEYWVVPACNFTGNVELSAGGARTRGDGFAFTDTVLQAKTVLDPLETNGWGLGLVAGLASERGHAWDDNAYVTVPLSVSWLDDRWIAHFNGGMVHRRGAKAVATWGLGGEIQLREDLHFLPEIFRSESGRPFYQLGLRYWILKDVVQLDATYGDRLVSQGERWFTIGVHIQTAPFIR